MGWADFFDKLRMRLVFVMLMHLNKLTLAADGMGRFFIKSPFGSGGMGWTYFIYLLNKLTLDIGKMNGLL